RDRARLPGKRRSTPLPSTPYRLGSVVSSRAATGSFCCLSPERTRSILATFRRHLRLRKRERDIRSRPVRGMTIRIRTTLQPYLTAPSICRNAARTSPIEDNERALQLILCEGGTMRRAGPPIVGLGVVSVLFIFQ